MHRRRPPFFWNLQKWCRFRNAWQLLKSQLCCAAICCHADFAASKSGPRWAYQLLQQPNWYTKFLSFFQVHAFFGLDTLIYYRTTYSCGLVSCSNHFVGRWQLHLHLMHFVASKLMTIVVFDFECITSLLNWRRDSDGDHIIRKGSFTGLSLSTQNHEQSSFK